MAKQNRSKLKTHFQTGDIPNQSEYSHLIDSQLNLEDTEIQTIKGGIDCDGGVTGSGVLKGSGLHVTSQASELGGTLAVTGTTSLNNDTLIQGNLNISASDGHITASGNISSSGTLTVDTITNVNTTHVTASGNVSASGNITTNELTARGHITASGNITASLLRAENILLPSPISAIAFSSIGSLDDQFITGTGNVIKIDGDNYVQLIADNEVKINAPKLGIGTNYSTDNTDQVPEALTVTGNISASGTIIGTDISASGAISASGMFVNGVGTASFGISGQGHVEIKGNTIHGFETDDTEKLGYSLTTGNQRGSIALFNSNNTISRVFFSGNQDGFINATGFGTTGLNIGHNAAGARMGDDSGAGGPKPNDDKHRKLNVFGGIMTTGSFEDTGGAGRVTLHDGHVTASGNLQVHGAQVDFTNLPTSDPSISGRLFTQTATELGGSGTTKVICVSAG
jgi:hypothetical protein